MEQGAAGISNRPLAVSVARAAELLGLSKTTVWGFVRTGDLTSARLGRRVLIPVNSLESFLKEATR
jgi:excisionase family DNA binding protein